MAGPQANIPVLRLLLTEDNPADAELELRELKRAGLRIAHRIADTEQGFVSALREFSPDVILSDFSMPGFDGMAALALARDLAPDTPFVFVSGTLGEEYAIRALRNGATDYVLKTNLVRLPAAVERAFTESKERRARRRLTRIRAFSSRINWALLPPPSRTTSRTTAACARGRNSFRSGSGRWRLSRWSSTARRPACSGCSPPRSAISTRTR